MESINDKACSAGLDKHMNDIQKEK